MSYTGLSFSSQGFVKGYWNHLSQNPNVLVIQHCRKTVHAIFVASLDDDTDFRIKLGPYTWRVHSSLISQESEFFRTASAGEWKESETRVAELHDDEPWMVGRMLQYFYYKQYDYDHHGGGSGSSKGGKRGSSSVDVTMGSGGGGSGSSAVVTLEKLMSVGRGRDPGYEDEKSRDAKYSAPDVDLHMYIVADKYGVKNLKSKILMNFIGQGKIAAADLMGMCDEVLKGVISRDIELKRAVAGKVARCYRDTIVQGSKDSVRLLDEWLLADPQICLLAMEQMNPPTF